MSAVALTSILLDLVSALTLVTVLMLSLRRADRSARTGCIYKTAATIALMLIADSICYVFTEAGTPCSNNIVFAARSVYFILMALTVCFWMQFVGESVLEKSPCKRRYHVLHNIAFLINVLVVTVNVFVPFMFTITDAGRFAACPTGMWIFTLVNYIMSALAAVLLISKKDVISRVDYVPMVVLMIPPLVGELINLILRRGISVVCMYSISAVVLIHLMQTYSAYTDDLTGLGNRRHLTETLDRWFSDPREHLICGLLIDIDGLKTINDTYGHTVGDDAIIAVAEILDGLKNTDIEKARYGGDEFLIAWRAKSEAELGEVTRELEAARDEANKASPVPTGVHFSIGGECASNRTLTREEFMQVMDKNMYFKKQEIDRVIEKALEEDSFEVWYQPVFSVADGKFRSAEALLRLNTPEKGFISPAKIVAAAERSGAVSRIDKMIITKVCDFIQSDEFEKLGIDRIFVNLSVVECMMENLSDIILSRLAERGVSTDKIGFEVTETFFSVKDENFLRNLQELSAAGIRLALDDFGTGFSNLYRLCGLPFSTIKLDKTLIDRLDDPRIHLVIKGTIWTINELNLSAVAEGVETKEQLEDISALGCGDIQGYYFSKPLPQAEFMEFLLEKNTESDE